jgi:hypothetical protein
VLCVRLRGVDIGSREDRLAVGRYQSVGVVGVQMGEQDMVDVCGIDLRSGQITCDPTCLGSHRFATACVNQNPLSGLPRCCCVKPATSAGCPGGVPLRHDPGRHPLRRAAQGARCVHPDDAESGGHRYRRWMLSLPMPKSYADLGIPWLGVAPGREPVNCEQRRRLVDFDGCRGEARRRQHSASEPMSVELEQHLAAAFGRQGMFECLAVVVQAVDRFDWNRQLAVGYQAAQISERVDDFTSGRGAVPGAEPEARVADFPQKQRVAGYISWLPGH